MNESFGSLRARAVNAWDAMTERWRTKGGQPGGNLNEGADVSRHNWRTLVVLLAVVVVLYYPVGMLWYQSIDDDLNLQPAPEYVVPGGSKVVATVATVVSREADHWAPNKPFWHPAHALDNMPNFQLGVIYAVSRFAVELGDYLGRARGSSSIDPNLDQAAGLFKYDGRTWYWGQGNVRPSYLKRPAA